MEYGDGKVEEGARQGSNPSYGTLLTSSRGVPKERRMRPVGRQNV
jgi:hypothetical protein